ERRHLRIKTTRSTPPQTPTPLPTSNCTVSSQLVDQPLGPLQLQIIEALGEPAMNWGEKIVGLLSFTLIAPQPRHAHRRAEFPGLCLLFAGNRECAFEINFSLCGIRFRRYGREFARCSLDLCFVPCFLGCFSR